MKQPKAAVEVYAIKVTLPGDVRLRSVSEGVREALRYAAEAVREQELPVGGGS